MPKLPAIQCPECGQSIDSEPYTPKSNGRPPTARGYDTCLRRCEWCGFGFSNARTEKVDRLTIVYRESFWNLPEYIAAGHNEVLDGALNRINRPTKRLKFMSSKSEDHLTWTVFRHLQLAQKLGNVMRRLGIDFNSNPPIKPTLLLWGCPVPPMDAAGRIVQGQLIKVLNRLGENLQRRSEPDVVLDYGERGTIFIEVKHGSPNDVKPADYKGWPTYLRDTDAFRSAESVQKTGLYELARNWRIAWDLAGHGPMALINLGPGELFQGASKGKVLAFSESLNQGELKRFLIFSWRRFFDAVPPPPPWLGQYLDNRGVG